MKLLQGSKPSSIILNIEANGLDPKEIWCCTTIDIQTGEEHVFRRPDLDPHPLIDYLRDTTHLVGHNVLSYDVPALGRLVGGFDEWYNAGLQAVDTLVISRLLDYSRDGGHSLAAWAPTLKVQKTEQPPWEEFSEALVDHSLQNCRITLALYKRFLPYLNSKRWRSSIDLEHFMVHACREINVNGFHFNVDKARELRYNINIELESLDAELLTAFQPKVIQVREVTPRLTKFGTLNRNDFRWADGGDLSDFNGGSFSLIEYQQFNPGSPSQIVERLNEAGWRPVEKTKGHLKFLRDKAQRGWVTSPEAEAKAIKYSQYGWTVSENNLNTLPSTEPHEHWLNDWRIILSKNDANVIELTTLVRKISGAEKHETVTLPILSFSKTECFATTTNFLSTIITEWLPSEMDVATFVESQRNLWSITATPTDTFVDCSATDATLGWTGLRDTAKLRNTISTRRAAQTLAKRIKYASRVRVLDEWLSNVREDNRIHGTINSIGTWTHRCSHDKPNTGNIPRDDALFGREMRSLWCVDDGYLVGVDAEGIQLRVLAHYINDDKFTQSLISGKKEDGTDPHSLNKLALGQPCKSRNDAKTFIYAWLLGAGVGKVSEILECSHRDAKQSVDDFIGYYPGLKELKRSIIPRDAGRGYFEGFDGRYINIFGEDQGSREHFALAGYLQAGEAIVMKTAMGIWMPKLKKEKVPFKLVNFVHDEWQTQVADRDCAIYIGEVQASAIQEAGERLGLRCPMAGSVLSGHGGLAIGSNWYETH